MKTSFAVVMLLMCLAGLMAIVDAQNRYTNLYNRLVVSARKMNRPLGSSGGGFGALPHSGVVVTLDDGSTWLVHKGQDYSRGSSGCQAVVTDDRYMSSAWYLVDYATCHQRHRLGSYVREAGCQYNLFFDNCWNAADRMMSLCRRGASTSSSWWGRR